MNKLNTEITKEMFEERRKAILEQRDEVIAERNKFEDQLKVLNTKLSQVDADEIKYLKDNL
jgi:hypothetical protein